MHIPAKWLTFKVLNHFQSRLDTMDAPTARDYFEKISKTTKRPRIKQVEDTAVNGVSVRVYKDSASVDQGALLFFHGGGFVVGSVNSHDRLCRLLCKHTGRTVISVDYRLAPEYPYPAAIEDGQAVLGCLDQLADTFGFDATHIVAAGDSAGGHMALYLTVRAPGKIKSLVMMYPSLSDALDTSSMHEFATGLFMTRKNMRMFWDNYLQGQKLDRLTDKQVASLPPTFIMTSQYDILRDEGHDFYEQLETAGVKTEYKCYQGMPHGFMQLQKLISRRDEGLRDIRDFLKRQ